MKNPAIILAIGVFFVLLWLYATNRISGILCSILCAILCALAVAREATVKILALVFLAGAAVGVAAMSEISGTAFSHAGAKAAGAVETATQRLISVSNAHNRKL